MRIQRKKNYRQSLDASMGEYQRRRPPSHDWHDPSTGKGLKVQRLQDFAFGQKRLHRTQEDADDDWSEFENMEDEMGDRPKRTNDLDNLNENEDPAPV